MDFHPFANDYPMLPESLIAIIVDDMQRNGFDPQFPIVTYQKKILEGRNRFVAAELADVKPTFVAFEGNDEEAREFVQRANDNRRHEQTDVIASRRDRIANLRRQGNSIPSIAAEEGISTATVQRDLQASANLDGGVKVEPIGGKVVGKDNKVRTAKPKKPRKPRKKKPKQLLCPFCKHRKKLGRPMPENCPDCAEFRESKNGKPHASSDADESVTVDSLKKAVPESLREIFQQVGEFRSIMYAVAALKSRCNEFGKHAACGWLDHQDLERSLEQAHRHLRFAMPYTECPKCRREIKAKCTTCKGTGWINESIYGSSASDADKRWLEGRS